MVTSSPTKKDYLWKQGLNFALLFTHIILLFGISAIAFDREHFEVISNSIYGNNVPLMQSNLADIFVSPWFAYLCLVLIPITLVKERLLKKYNARIYLNVLASLIFGAINFIFIVNLYSV
ncbi:hypothetical protein H5119_09325 [Pseudoalteromonas sp. SG45-5]|uniref:hypothetical protein n=1 Tax=unclassified Pseudoalteromonas TaxID=194690 RepID=UPI0015FB655B|nr:MULTISPECIES: hypothetical protein [unclassified Pseudoalteromonas]MBB1385740.1 hypothetical protein [Pseudoalteromonas sp. SG45-5]MBB1393629.1 hypothetical protein [Pseudoalteromonas sp. SG44-4]MBB1446222.1 hypothetical protein [Pseudoalteromonas sp. SG41-6]